MKTPWPRRSTPPGPPALPKGVFYSHRQIMLHTYGLMSGICIYKSQLTLDSADVYMPITPMFHVHAWGVPYLCTMIGTKQVYPGRYEPEMLLKLLLAEKVTFSHCVPTILHMLVSSPAVKNFDLSNWKVIIGGSAMSKGLCKASLDLGINVTSAYGMSETCPLLTAANMKPHMLDWDAEQAGGHPLQNRPAGAECQPGDPRSRNGQPLPHDGQSAGEVVVRTPWLTQGYVKDPEKSEELWKDGWLHTGDVGMIDTDGYLQITDRMKDVIKTGGEWISSLELEDIISQHEAVSEAAVIGVPDDKWGERPLTLVVLKPDYADKVTGEDLKKFYTAFVENGTIPKYGVPDRVVITDQIAKTSVGKINKKEIRTQYRS
jgi:fatty-acyl-CoA synthase